MTANSVGAGVCNWPLVFTKFQFVTPAAPSSSVLINCNSSSVGDRMFNALSPTLGICTVLELTFIKRPVLSAMAWQQQPRLTKPRAKSLQKKFRQTVVGERKKTMEFIGLRFCARSSWFVVGVLTAFL